MSYMRTVSARLLLERGKDGKPGVYSNTVKSEYDFGLDLAEKVKIFGEPYCSNAINAKLSAGVQEIQRSGIRKKQTPKQTQKAVTDWNPQIKRTKTTAVEKSLKRFNDLPDDEKREFLETVNKN